jgi:hypothetical protein
MHSAHSRTAALPVVSDTTMPHLSSSGEEKQTPLMKRKKTMNIVHQFKEAAHKRALYVKTRDEIARMPLDVALDLDIFRGDAERIAYEAVYGKAA